MITFKGLDVEFPPYVIRKEGGVGNSRVIYNRDKSPRVLVYALETGDESLGFHEKFLGMCYFDFKKGCWVSDTRYWREREIQPQNTFWLSVESVDWKDGRVSFPPLRGDFLVEHKERIGSEVARSFLVTDWVDGVHWIENFFDYDRNCQDLISSRWVVWENIHLDSRWEVACRFNNGEPNLGKF